MPSSLAAMQGSSASRILIASDILLTLLSDFRVMASVVPDYPEKS
jgi:hypothetical protein